VEIRPEPFDKLIAHATTPVIAAALVIRWRPVRPGVEPISERQRRPYFARIKALSVLPT
jgi:hypothetical protein